MRRVNERSMTRIEEVEEEDDEEVVDLIEMLREWGNKPHARMVKVKEVQVFDISQGDEELNELDEYQMWYEEDRPEVKQESVENPSPSPSAQEEDRPEVRQESIENPSPSPSVQEASKDRVRTVRLPGYEDLIEVVLDSGADCHVLPLSYYSEDLGEVELPALKMVITDAQGNAIRTTEARTNITFEFQRSDGKVIKVKDTAVFGQVTQPLFAVGKLYKVGWGIEPQDAYSAFLTKASEEEEWNVGIICPDKVFKELNGDGP